MDIRMMKVTDIPHVQQANITNLPENYFCKYYMYHALTWPQLSYVAVDVSCSPLQPCDLQGEISMPIPQQKLVQVT
jgi:peptide alpha-N-acetyltransferase